MNKWYETSGEEKDIVISTRIRLARNVKEFPFEHRMSLAQKEKLIDQVTSAVSHANFGDNLQCSVLRSGDMSSAQLQSMLERHLISPAFASGKQGGAVLLSQDDSVCIMMNEEDHLRIQVLQSGLNLEEAFKLANQFDDLLDESLHYAFDEQLGYLTQCPTNLGTALRASVMMHLPMIEKSGLIPNLTTSLSKMGITIRGTFGEGTSVQNAVYQISNQVTLGISEEQTLENLKEVIHSILGQECHLREQIKLNPHMIDRIKRAEGLLRSAYLLTSTECVNLLFLVRLGISCHIITDVTIESLNRLYHQSGSATISLGGYLKDMERDQARAKLVQSVL